MRIPKGIYFIYDIYVHLYLHQSMQVYIELQYIAILFTVDSSSCSISGTRGISTWLFVISPGHVSRQPCCRWVLQRNAWCFGKDGERTHISIRFRTVCWCRWEFMNNSWMKNFSGSFEASEYVWINDETLRHLFCKTKERGVSLDEINKHNCTW
jgi:hypothetical protein